MFTLLVVLLIVVAWVFGKIASAASHIVEQIGDPRDKVCKLNGAYHQASLEARKTAASLYVAGKRSYQDRRAS